MRVQRQTFRAKSALCHRVLKQLSVRVPIAIGIENLAQISFPVFLFRIFGISFHFVPLAF